MTELSVQFINKLPHEQIRLMKVKSVRTIASFNSNANNQSVQFMSEINCFGIDQTYESQIDNKKNDKQPHSIKQSTIKQNTFIIIILIGKRPGAAEVRRLKVNVER